MVCGEWSWSRWREVRYLVSQIGGGGNLREKQPDRSFRCREALGLANLGALYIGGLAIGSNKGVFSQGFFARGFGDAGEILKLVFGAVVI